MQDSGIDEAITEDALAVLQPDLPAGALESVFRKLTRPEFASITVRLHVLYCELSRGRYPWLRAAPDISLADGVSPSSDLGGASLRG